MGKPLQPYRRTPGTVDPGADFARQVTRLNQRVSVLEAPFTPPYGDLIVDATVPGDGARHFVAHRLGRAYRMANVGPYLVYRAGVFIISPDEVRSVGEDPAKVVGVFGLSASGDNLVTIWVL
jgi:hypothetical protein